jgi:glycosyltransferase involved in cell wall biosynthesis
MKKLKILFSVYPWAFDCPGGGERQLLAYKNHLEKLGIEVSLYNQWDPNIKEYDIFHFFSVMPGSFQLCEYIKNQGLKLFISPNLWVTPETKYNYPHDEIKKLLNIADKIVVNSNLEAQALSEVYELPLSTFCIIYNGVEDKFFNEINAELFIDKYNLTNTKYILNVANIEPRKNQLNFLKALKKFPDLKLVTVGHIRDEKYANECFSLSNDQFIFIGSLPYGSDLLSSAYRKCEFFAMPSTLETPSIAALEAAAVGSNILITEIGSTKEYFMDKAEYISPNNIESIEIAISNLLERKNNELSNLIKSFYSWEKVCEKLKIEYIESLGEKMKRKPILYFDCTSTIRSGLKTGVQRVVRELLLQKEIFEKNTGILFEPICHQYNWYYKLEDALEMTEKTQYQYEKIQPVYDDIYFCADSYWSYDIVKWLPYFKNLGVKIINVCYDLIPINHSEYFSDNQVNDFKLATNEIIKYSDLILCISNSTQLDLEDYILFNNFNSPKIDNFNLAVTSFDNSLSNELNKKLKNKKYMLMVGTIEARKEYLKTINEFEKLWNAGFDYELIIVGKLDENYTKFIEKYDYLVTNNYPLKIFSNIEDNELVTLYKNSQAVIVSSNAEGYGLPLAEAMNFNKPVYANRLRVFGEFAGSYPIYFDINKENDLFSKLQEHEKNSWFKSYFKSNSWSDSAKEISNKIFDLFDLNRIKINSEEVTKETIQWAYKLYFNTYPDEGGLEYWLKENDYKRMVDTFKYELKKDK